MGVATMANKKMLSVTFVDCVNDSKHIQAFFQWFRLIGYAYKFLRRLDL